MTEQYDPKTLKPSRGAPVKFIGRIIAETKWTTNDGCWMRFTLWETRGGAYIAQTSGDVPGKPDQVHCSVTVVEPIWKVEQPVVKVRDDGFHVLGEKQAARDETAMQIAVLQHWDFHDRAKAMVKRELGWAPCIEVA